MTRARRRGPRPARRADRRGHRRPGRGCAAGSSDDEATTGPGAAVAEPAPPADQAPDVEGQDREVGDAEEGDEPVASPPPAAGLEVHAWVSVAPTWHAVYEDLPTPEGWVPAAHGRDAPEADRWVTRTVDGDWSECLDPALPAVRDHVAAIAVELATTTGVDGIHLDYVRYESARHGYHPDVLARYREETGADAVAMPAPDDPAFVAWRQEQTTGLWRHVRSALAGADAQVVLSAPVITWGPGPSGTSTGRFADTRTARDGLQDWPDWARNGLVDVLFPMNCFREHEPDQVGWFEQWLDLEAELAMTTDTLIVPGIGGWLNTPRGHGGAGGAGQPGDRRRCGVLLPAARGYRRARGVARARGTRLGRDVARRGREVPRRVGPVPGWCLAPR